MATNPRNIPKFASEDEEREFWANQDLTDYFNTTNAVVVDAANAFPNLRRTEELIEFTIPEEDIELVRSLAEKYHLSRAALARKYFLEAIHREIQGTRPASGS